MNPGQRATKVKSGGGTDCALGKGGGCGGLGEGGKNGGMGGWVSIVIAPPAPLENVSLHLQHPHPLSIGLAEKGYWQNPMWLRSIHKQKCNKGT
jgi:hypothetical protein